MLRKNGFTRGHQRFLCKTCNRNQICIDRRIKHSNSKRHLAISMYLNGAGFRSIGRVLNVSFLDQKSWKNS